MESLCKDHVFNIIRHVEIKELLRFRLVCKLFYFTLSSKDTIKYLIRTYACELNESSFNMVFINIYPVPKSLKVMEFGKVVRLMIDRGVYIKNAIMNRICVGGASIYYHKFKLDDLTPYEIDTIGELLAIRLIATDVMIFHNVIYNKEELLLSVITHAVRLNRDFGFLKVFTRLLIGASIKINSYIDRNIANTLYQLASSNSGVDFLEFIYCTSCKSLTDPQQLLDNKICCAKTIASNADMIELILHYQSELYIGEIVAQLVSGVTPDNVT